MDSVRRPLLGRGPVRERRSVKTMRVLVVDDEDASRYLISSLLKGHGYDVVEAVDGVDALDKARQQPVDIVVTDILMPNMDGYQLCREWKADPDLRRAPIVFYSATYTEAADESFAESLGVDAFFIKPQEPDVLVALIEDVLRRYEETDIKARPAQERGEAQVLREYSERLVNKLEQKIVELNKANADLRGAIEVLSEEVEVKSGLIVQLTTDLHDKEVVESHLRATNELLEATIEESPIPVIVADADMHIQVWNPAAAEVFGFTSEDVASMELEMAGAERSLLESVLAGEVPGATQARTSRRKDGTEVAYTATVTPLHDAAGSITGFVAVLREWDDAKL